MKTEVYSWRVLAESKSGLQHEESQRRLHAAAEKFIGTLKGGGARSEQVGRLVRERLRSRYCR